MGVNKALFTPIIFPFNLPTCIPTLPATPTRDSDPGVITLDSCSTPVKT